MCRFNDLQFNSTFEIGAYVCQGALTPEQRETVQEVFADVDKESEDALLEAALKQDMEQLLVHGPRALGLEVPPDTFKIVKKFTSQLTPKDITTLMNLVSDPEVAPKIPALLKACLLYTSPSPRD